MRHQSHVFDSYRINPLDLGICSERLARANRELSLATQLLDSVAMPQANVCQPVPIPPPQFPSDATANLKWHIDTASVAHLANTACVTGWAFCPTEADDQHSAPTLLLEYQGRWFAVAGDRVDRPDVVEAFPPAAGELPCPRDSGFLFEFRIEKLPGAIENYCVAHIGRDHFLKSTPLLTLV